MNSYGADDYKNKQSLFRLQPAVQQTIAIVWTSKELYRVLRSFSPFPAYHKLGTVGVEALQGAKILRQGIEPLGLDTRVGGLKRHFVRARRACRNASMSVRMALGNGTRLYQVCVRLCEDRGENDEERDKNEE